MPNLTEYYFEAGQLLKGPMKTQQLLDAKNPEVI